MNPMNLYPFRLPFSGRTVLFSLSGKMENTPGSAKGMIDGHLSESDRLCSITRIHMSHFDNDHCPFSRRSDFVEIFHGICTCVWWGYWKCGCEKKIGYIIIYVHSMFGICISRCTFFVRDASPINQSYFAISAYIYMYLYGYDKAGLKGPRVKNRIVNSYDSRYWNFNLQG